MSRGTGISLSTSLGNCLSDLQISPSLRTTARSGPYADGIHTSFSNTITGEIASTDSRILAKRLGEVMEAVLRLLAWRMLARAVLVLVFEDDAEGRLADAMILEDGTVDVKSKSASVLTVGAALTVA